jgi:hypothetical protein
VLEVEKLGQTTVGKVKTEWLTKGALSPTDLYNENYKILKKEIEEDSRRQKELPCSWISRINIMKVTKIPKVIYRFKATSWGYTQKTVTQGTPEAPAHPCLLQHYSQ